MIGFDGVAASAGRPARWGELMLTFVSAQEASMEAFLSLSAASRYQGLSRGYADSLLRQGCTRPAWCVVGLEAGVPVARAALWSTPDRSIPTDVVLIEVNWGDRDLADGMALLNQLHERARALGADVLMHSVDAPPRAPQHQEDEEARIRFLKGSGYELLWAGLPWSFTASTARGPAEDPSLAFRSLAEVGEDAFVETMASTYEGTRDSWLILNVNERGGLEAARSDFRDYQEMHHHPIWWDLAHTTDGALDGVIMAARNPSSAVIAYVGVVPELRGRGLAARLVRRGTLGQRMVRGGQGARRGQDPPLLAGDAAGHGRGDEQVLCGWWV
jgi:GNAT superfamily N-acetyltransferase